MTNFHVIQGQTSLKALFEKGFSYPVRVIRYNEESDLALIEVNTSNTNPIEVSDKTIQEGSDVIIIGAPIGFSYSVTKGIVSGLRFGSGITYIQTDASINPGNSGGPMINSDNQVISIVTLKFVSEDIEGMGFGIEINDALRALGIRMK